MSPDPPPALERMSSVDSSDGGLLHSSNSTAARSAHTHHHPQPALDDSSAQQQQQQPQMQQQQRQLYKMHELDVAAMIAEEEREIWTRCTTSALELQHIVETMLGIHYDLIQFMNYLINI